MKTRDGKTRLEILMPESMNHGIQRAAALYGNKASPWVRQLVARELDRLFGDTWHTFGDESELTDDSM